MLTCELAIFQWAGHSEAPGQGLPVHFRQARRTGRCVCVYKSGGSAQYSGEAVVREKTNQLYPWDWGNGSGHSGAIQVWKL